MKTISDDDVIALIGREDILDSLLPRWLTRIAPKDHRSFIPPFLSNNHISTAFRLFPFTHFVDSVPFLFSDFHFFGFCSWVVWLHLAYFLGVHRTSSRLSCLFWSSYGAGGVVRLHGAGLAERAFVCGKARVRLFRSSHLISARACSKVQFQSQKDSQ